MQTGSSKDPGFPSRQLGCLLSFQTENQECLLLKNNIVRWLEPNTDIFLTLRLLRNDFHDFLAQNCSGIWGQIRTEKSELLNRIFRFLS